MKEVDVLNTVNLLTTKPVIYLINMSENDYLKQKNKWLPKIKTWVESRNPKDTMIPYSADFELKLSFMSAEEATAYCTENKTRSMLNRIIRTGFNRLRLCNFFTCGKDEVKAWTLHVRIELVCKTHTTDPYQGTSSCRNHSH